MFHSHPDFCQIYDNQMKNFQLQEKTLLTLFSLLVLIFFYLTICFNERPFNENPIRQYFQGKKKLKLP